MSEAVGTELLPVIDDDEEDDNEAPVDATKNTQNANTHQTDMVLILLRKQNKTTNNLESVRGVDEAATDGDVSHGEACLIAV